MAIKDILLVLTSYPDPTPVDAVDEPIAFAVAIGARISAIACEEKIQLPSNALANALLDLQAIVAAEAKKSSTNAKNLLAAFQVAAEKRGVFQDRILERCLTSEAPDLLVEQPDFGISRLCPRWWVMMPTSGTPNRSYSTPDAQHSSYRIGRNAQTHSH